MQQWLIALATQWIRSLGWAQLASSSVGVTHAATEEGLADV